MTFDISSTVYIVKSNWIVREATVVKRSGDFYIIRFGTEGGFRSEVADFLQVKKMHKRLFAKEKIIKRYIVRRMIIITRMTEGIMQKKYVDIPLYFLYTEISKLANKQAC